MASLLPLCSPPSFYPFATRNTKVRHKLKNPFPNCLTNYRNCPTYLIPIPLFRLPYVYFSSEMRGRRSRICLGEFLRHEACMLTILRIWKVISIRELGLWERKFKLQDLYSRSSLNLCTMLFEMLSVLLKIYHSI